METCKDLDELTAVALAGGAALSASVALLCGFAKLTLKGSTAYSSLALQQVKMSFPVHCKAQIL